MCEKSAEDVAVYARNVFFSYTKSEPLLKGINLTIERNTIYGLLGSSGCGKTTLLKCILGRLKPNNGEVKVFGTTPGSPESHIPGPGVGYMPQELGVYFEFTIEEIIIYFGRIYSMSKSEISEGVDHLIRLLHLPNKNRFIGLLSGGQQRRVSLACTLLHSPPILILDEPTVGTDPVLRRNIWLHLNSLCKLGQTIILTTHYIDEAGMANTVAFMRSGKILAEDDPKTLLNKYVATNLEEVFLKLCHYESEEPIDETVVDIELKDRNYYKTEFNENKSTESERIDTKQDFIRKTALKNKRQSLEARDQSEDVENNSSLFVSMDKKDDITYNRRKFSVEIDSNKNVLHRIRKSRFTDKCSAILLKNYKHITRKVTHCFFEICFPAMMLSVLIFSISDGPTHLNLAVFDEELTNNVTDGWGEIFVDKIDKGVFNVFYYNSFDEAIDSVKSGENYAAIDIGERFTNALRLRFLYLMDPDEVIVEESQIYVYVDRSNQLVGFQIERYLYEAMMSFIVFAGNRSNIDPDSIKVPLVFEEPIYGNREEALKEFILPGIYIAVTFYIETAIISHMIYEERQDGLLERSFVAGITASEFLISNLITQFFILCLQIVILSLLPYILLGRQLTGSFTIFIALLLSQGFCGVALGLMVSVMIKEVIQLLLTIFFLFVSSLATSGVLWPVENMPPWFQTFAKFMPNTAAVQAMRDIIYREWTIEHYEVYIGFVVSYVWFAIFFIIALIFLKRKL